MSRVSPGGVFRWFVPRLTSQETKTKVHETRTRVDDQPDANQIRLLLGWPCERHEPWGVPGWSKWLIAAKLVETSTAAHSTVALVYLDDMRMSPSLDIHCASGVNHRGNKE
ncbi:hypothetical protein N7448_006735 [Penicillium atrosanguineum]|uniref:acetyltransferase n=1 Tax=Penicillium atrosanguineum TaxID=1132637 RepID=UPI00238B1726|nr:acetyltransferase [Penicillium atrosanguineum]KAJ5132577.1 hypothetical protein N7448_006735 [Penicillium atrosanguineum]KAJ5141539.1 hypothetical protein N7526_002534 [Penicillium atrosanguineum]KAJ5290243.1 acetyltransferase [Penicillium atrosanguineum]